MSRRLIFPTILVLMLTACGGSSDNEATSPPSSATPVSGATRETVASVTTQVAEQPGWREEPMGTIAGAFGGIDTIAFAPDGSAVAFSLVDISCCSNRVHGWTRTTTGEWSEIDTAAVGFVAGADGLGAYGGPTDVAWFDGRFIAVGTRGGQSEPERAPTSTTWVSDDGIAWNAFDDPTGSRLSGLAVSFDGSTLLGVRTTDDGVAEIRSTTDGESWTDVATLTSDTPGTGLSSLSMTRVTLGTDLPAYVIVGSRFPTKGNGRNEPYASVSTDGRTWTPVSLAVPETTTPQSFAVTDAVVLDGTLVLYGFGYGDAGEEDTTQLGWRSEDGTTFPSFAVAQPCGGTFTSIVADQRAPEPTLFAICSAVVGPVEGDSVDIRTELVVSGDAKNFTRAPVTPPQWGEPSVEVNLGPVAVGRNGSVVVAVATPGSADDRAVTLWTS